MRARTDDRHPNTRPAGGFGDVDERGPALEQLRRRASLRVDEEADLYGVQPRARSDRHRLNDPRIPMTNELSRRAQLPGMVVSLKSIAPRGQRAQSGLAPRRGADIHDGRIAASEHGREVDDAATQPGDEPGRILVTPVVHPFWLGPPVRRRRKHHRIARRSPAARSPCALTADSCHPSAEGNGV